MLRQVGQLLLGRRLVEPAPGLVRALVGLVLVMGLANQISLGQGAFMLIGGYTAAILTATHGWNLALAAVTAVAVAAAGATVIGGLALRLTGFNLAIATLGIHLILLVMVTQWEFTGATLGEPGDDR